jgi:hypothetical protein
MCREWREKKRDRANEYHDDKYAKAVALDGICISSYACLRHLAGKGDVLDP